MGSFSIKKLDPSEPLSLYSDLEKSLEFGENYATSSNDHDKYGKVYYLGGLEVFNLNTASLSEETIARLYNALESGNIYYAVFPDDQRKGRLPLVLNKKTRAFLKTLPELINNESVKWYLYQLPADIDPDNNERRGSDFVTDDDGQEIELTFDELQNHISNYGFVKEQKQEEESVFDSDEEDEEENGQANNELPPDKDENKNRKINENHNESNDNEQPQNDDVSEDDNEFENAMFEEDDEFENPEDTDEKAEFDEVFAEPNIKDKTVEEYDIANVENEVKDKSESEKNNEIEYIKNDETKNISLSERTKTYVQLPKIVEEIVENISLPRFTSYPTNNVYDVTSDTMKKEVNDSNARIEELENSIKREARQLYRNYMHESYLSIIAQLDTETGNQSVIDTYQKYINSKNELDQEFDQEIIDKKAELEEVFYGQNFEEYKARVNAQVREWYEDERYNKDVAQPLDDYIKERKETYEDRKLDKTTDFNAWINTLETTAIGKDQQEAINKLTEFIQSKVNDSMGNIESLQRRMDQVNQSLAQLEYQERAIENIRKNFGTDLEQDEQAKIYKRKLDTAIDEKAELHAAFRKFEAETKEQKKEMEDTHKKELEEINHNHTLLIAKLQNQKESLEQDYQKKQEVADRLRKENDSNAKKTGLKFGGVAALATALVVGGCSMINNHTNQNSQNDKIEQQAKEIKNSNKKIDEQSKQLKAKEQEIQTQKDKVKEEQEKSKKSSDKK